MTRRVGLPGADELLRATGTDGGGAPAPAAVSEAVAAPAAPAAAVLASVPPAPAAGRPTGRERHDVKITVYLSQEELIDLERAKLALREEHGLGVDRGRIVRAAVALALSDLAAAGRRSDLLHHLTADD